MQVLVISDRIFSLALENKERKGGKGNSAVAMLQIVADMENTVLQYRH
jgi:hypothetical protein